MSDTTDAIQTLQDNLETMKTTIDRHARVLEKIADAPSNYQPAQIEAYVETLDASVDNDSFLADAEEALAPLETKTNEAEKAMLDEAQVFVDDYEVEGVDLTEFNPEAGEATLLVPSPKVNQIRGGAQVLALSDGREFRFSITQTLIAEVADDKSGYLELILSIAPVD